jgi:hypothetical protein
LIHVKTAPASGCSLEHTAHVSVDRSIHMLDVILVVAAFGFFALSVGYTIACDRL